MTDDNDRDAAHWEAVEEAAELLREELHDEALVALNEVLAKDPKNPYAYNLRGGVYFERGVFDEAVKDYQRAVQYAPHFLGAQVNLGHALRMDGQLDAARAAGERALAMSKPTGSDGDGDAHYLLGLVHSQRGDARLAIEHLEAFLRSSPELEARTEAETMIQLLKGRAKILPPEKSN